MYQDLALYIDGEFIKGGDRREQDVINPATQELLGKLLIEVEAVDYDGAKIDQT